MLMNQWIQSVLQTVLELQWPEAKKTQMQAIPECPACRMVRSWDTHLTEPKALPILEVFASHVSEIAVRHRPSG